MIGHTISHYEIVEKIGEGGMGVVYKAKDTKLGRFVALKFLAPHLLLDEDAHRRFVREAKAAAALDHPNICTVYEIDEADGRTFIAMAFIEGQSLDKVVAAGPMKIEDAVEIAGQTARALAVAHDKGVVHRDIKPANILIAQSGSGRERQARLMDFGLAQLTGGSKISKGQSMLGTVAYMSPEQAKGIDVDRRADIWALGAILYEMLSGRMPFEGHFDQAIVYSILNEAPEPLTGLRTGIPQPLEAIVDKALEKDREKRYQRVDELLVDLRRLEDSTARSRAQPAPPPIAGRQSRVGLYAAACTVACAAFVGVAVWLGLFSPAPEPPAEPMRAVPLTSYPGSELDPDFSPDGNRIVFTWDGDKPANFDIYTKRLDSSSPVRLTTDPAIDINPKWSPDGRLIAFLRQAEPRGSTFNVLAIPALGGPEREVGTINLLPLEQVAYLESMDYLEWAPGGEFLIVADRASLDEAAGLFSLSLDSGARNRLTSPVGAIGDEGPTVSSDGGSLAFSRRSSYFQADLFVLRLSADVTPLDEPKQLTFEKGRSLNPVWTPDGREVLFAWSEDFRGRLARVDVEGTGKPHIIAAASNGTKPAVSPQGDRLIYSVLVGSSSVWRLPLAGSVDAPDAGASHLSSTQFDYNPQFSPEGSRIVFSSSRTGTTGIWLADADGGNVKPLHIQEGAHSGTPRWSPDGQRVVFDSNPAGNIDIYVISARGGEPIQVTSHASDDVMPSWSRDGRWLYFGSTRTGRHEIWKVSAGGGEAIQLTREGGAVAFESPDGRTVFYTKTDEATASLWTIPTDGGEEGQVAERVYARNMEVAGGGVYFIQSPDPSEPRGVFRLRFLDFSTGEIKTTATLPEGTEPNAGMSVAPDGSALLYSRIENQGSDLMMIENFR